MALVNVEFLGRNHDGLQIIEARLDCVTPILDGMAYPEVSGWVDVTIDYDDEVGIVGLSFVQWLFETDDRQPLPMRVSAKQIESMRGYLFDKIGEALGCHV